jgi:phage protein D
MTTPAVSTYVPDFELALDGRPAPTDLRGRVMAVRFEEALEGANRVEVEFANPDLRLLDRPLLDLDVQLDLSLGYRPAAIRHVFKGTITGVEPAFPAGGMPTMLISAHDATRRLGEGAKQRGFPFYLTDSVIATIIAAENQLIALPDAAASLITGLGVFNERPRLQHRQSDYDFLRQIAVEYGFDMWVDGDFLSFRLPLPGLPAPEIELRWGESLIEFSPRLSSIGQLVRIGAQIWVEALKTQIAVEVGWDGDRITTRVRPAVCGEQSGTVGATLSLPDLPAENAVDAIRFAVGELRRRVNSRVTARGSALGDPRFRAGRVLSVSRVGPHFNGNNYRLTSVAHMVDRNGYRTGFEARQEVI